MALSLLFGCGAAEVLELQGTELPFVEPRALFSRAIGESCPGPGVESDMFLSDGDRLVVADLHLVSECSGAGGDWIVGRIQGELRDLMLGDHACYFLGRVEDPVPKPAIGVARLSQTAALFHAPQGWCIQNLQGEEPVTSDSIVRSIALFDTHEEASAAVARWSRPRS